MQGWSPDFIPLVSSKAIDDKTIDEIRLVSGDDALTWSKRLAREEGIFCGITAGATFATACKLASEMPEGSRVLAMIPDTGERYMSTPLFAEIGEDMDEAEMEISRSTPGARFDAPVPAAPVAGSAPQPPAASAQALAHIDAIIFDSSEPLVVFALEWCEFCWSAFKLLDALGLSYCRVDLDGPDYLDAAWAADVRRALAETCGAPTVPQVYLGGAYLGGATELFDAWNSGALSTMLGDAGLGHSDPSLDDAYSLLPKWLQKR